MDIKTIFAKYNKTDKSKYADFYQRHFGKLSPSILLEIGVLEGDSLRAWKEIFPSAKIVGIDNKQPIKDACKDLTIYIGDQRDKVFLKSVIDSIGVPDIIIDDGGHTMTCQVQSLVHLFPMLESGGLYIIEDLETSYLKDFNDLPLSTMEYLKTLIDPTDFTNLNNPPPQNIFHYVASAITFEPNICLLRKT